VRLCEPGKRRYFQTPSIERTYRSVRDCCRCLYKRMIDNERVFVRRDIVLEVEQIPTQHDIHHRLRKGSDEPSRWLVARIVGKATMTSKKNVDCIFQKLARDQPNLYVCVNRNSFCVLLRISLNMCAHFNGGQSLCSQPLFVGTLPKSLLA
jgi:hypothetical protein